MHGNKYYIIRDIIPRVTDDGFEVYTAMLVDDDNKSRFVSIVDHRSPTYGKFLSKIIRLHANAIQAAPHNKSKRWTEFYNYKNQYLTIVPTYIPGEKYPITKDLDYGYGLTIHKLQGSTLDNIFVNIPDLLSFSNGQRNPLRQRLLYTAISWARKRVIFLR